MTTPLITRKLTPDEAFAEFRLFCRYGFGLSASHVEKHVRKETTIRELNQLDEVSDWVEFPGHFGVNLERNWGLRFRETDTVADLCAALAQETEVPVVEPIRLLGRKCDTASAFLTLKRMLADSGAEVSELAPSSRIDPYVRQHPRPFQRFRLAFPGSCPIVQRLNILQAIGCLLVVGTAFLWLTGCLCGWKDQAVLAAFPVMMIGGLLMILGRLCHDRFTHTFIEGVGRRPTFRDYIYALHGRHRQAGTT